MRRFRILAVVILASGLVAFNDVVARWVTAAGLDFWTLGREREGYEATCARRGELDATGLQQRQQRTLTSATVERLIRGEVSLVSATEEIELINSSRSAMVLRVYQSWYPKEFQGESAMHKAMAFYTLVQAYVLLGTEDSTRQAEVTARLKGEYEALFHQPPPMPHLMQSTAGDVTTIGEQPPVPLP